MGILQMDNFMERKAEILQGISSSTITLRLFFPIYSSYKMFRNFRYLI